MDSDEKKPKTSPIWLSTRMSIAIIGFFGFVNLYALRINMSVAIVCMVNQTALQDSMDQIPNASLPILECGKIQPSNESEFYPKSSTQGELNWPKAIQGHILGSFFYGYILTQLPGGWLSHRFGGRLVLGWSMCACAVATLLMPLAAGLHYGALMTLRIVAGMCQGVVWPAMHVVWSRWSPPLERSRLIGFTFAGSQIGNVLTLPLSGLLCEYGFGGGWPSIFYVFGSLGIIWCVVWMIIVYDSPADHPRVSEEERKYIESSLQGQITTEEEAPIPWRAIFTSLPFWGIIVTHTFSLFAIYSFLTNIPTYMKEVLGFDIKSNGALSALPYILFWFMINLSSVVADFLITRKYLSTGGCRKLFNTLAAVLMSVLMISLANVGCNQTILAVTLLTFGVSFTGFQYGSGFVVNHADIAPSYAGILFGISNTFGTIPGFVAPPVIGIITKNGLPSEWRIVFYLASGIHLIGAIFYLFTASGEVQPWAQQKSSRSYVHEEEEVLPLK